MGPGRYRNMVSQPMANHALVGQVDILMRSSKLIIKRKYEPDPEVEETAKLRRVYLHWIQDVYNDSKELTNRNGEVRNAESRSDNQGFDNPPT